VATGVEARAGLFERAHGGVLFLDEIADMSLGTQAQILRVLENRRVRRVGGATQRPASVQVIAASNRSLRSLVADGRFRRDLFHRLADWEARIPSLADRPRDIANLASHFLGLAAKELDKPIRGLTQGAVARLLVHDWPGNVRELQREMHRVAAFAPDYAVVTASDLAPAIGADRDERGDLAGQLLRFERRIIANALAATDDDVDAAAEALGISRSTLYRRLRATGLKADQSQD
jgi:transcriptional regulator with PAS, ATPase and Fis domain